MPIFRLKPSSTCLNIVHLHSALDPTVVECSEVCAFFWTFSQPQKPPMEDRYKIA